VTAAEQPPTHSNPLLSRQERVCGRGKGVLNAVLLIRLAQSVGHSILCVLCAAWKETGTQRQAHYKQNSLYVQLPLTSCRHSAARLIILYYRPTQEKQTDFN
jgi:hypothetical protein